MDRHRDVRRGMAATNGLARRRQRNNSLRDSPEEDGAVELHESTRLRDRVSKKDRDRLSRNKRRRGDRLMHGSNRDGGDEDSSEDSLDDEDEDDDDEPGPVRMRPPNPASSSVSNHHHRKSFPPAAKVARPTTTWKVSDEMGFSVPKKARSASTKRSHECWVSGGGGGVGGGSGSGEQIHRQASTSPARPNVVPSTAPGSPSSSTASVRKKMKPIGPKHRPPKISNNKPSSIQDDIEIEVAEVLYGLMRQSQGPTRQELATNSSQKLDSRDTNGSGNDAKSRVSSPISASPSSAAPQMSKLPQNSSSSTTPMSAVAPKRKRPRPVKFEEENSNSGMFGNKNGPSTSKVETEQSAKIEPSSSTKLERNTGSAESFNGVSFDFGNSQPPTVQSEVPPESSKPDSNTITDSKPLREESVVRDGDQTKKVVTSPQKESSSCAKVEFDPENATATKATPTAAVVENHREESFKIDLMAPPLKSSPERDSDMSFVSDLKPMVADIEMVQKMENHLKEKANVDTNCKKGIDEAVLLAKKTETTMVEESESQKSNVHKQTIDLQIDLEKHNKDCGPSIVRQQQQIQQQHQPKSIRNEPKTEKAAQSTNSLPLPMAMAGWPGGLPPMGNGMGQVRPLQGMTSLDGTPVSSNAVQPRPKRCATHYYIARNIYYHQQFTKMNPFWPAAAGSASLYGNKPYNLNVMPPSEAAIIGSPLLGSFSGRNLNPIQEKVQVEGAKDKSSVAANFLDSQPGKLVSKQLLLQQPPQQAALHGPAFIFPLNQQQAAVPPGSKAGAAKSSNAGNAVSSLGSQPPAGAPGNSSSTAGTSSTMSFNYPNMQPSEAQYVAILQNNGYPFPVPAHVGAPTSYRGTPPQALPFFNGQFYSSQMMHPQLQQQQQLQQLQQSQTQQQSVQQGHQNTSTSSGSSSSQKHQHTQQQNHQQRLQSGSNAASGNSNNFHSKNRPQKPQNQSFPASHQARQLETEMTVEDGPSNEDSRVAQAHKNAYGHNFNMPIHPKNFPSMSSAAMAGGAGGNHSEKQQQQQQQQQQQLQHQQQQSMKAGPELIQAQAYAMPFASFNGGTPVSGLDFSSMAQNHVIFQSLPEAARHNYQIAAAAAAQAQQKKMHQVQEDGKAASESHNADDERKAVIGKGSPNVAQAIVFSRPDSTDPSVSILGNSVVESSGRTLNLISSPSNGNRSSRSTISTTSAVPSTTNNVNAPNSQQQMNQLFHLQKQQQQQMQVMHQQQQQLHQQLAAAAAARGKPSTTSSSSVYSDRLSSSSSMAAKFSNSHYFPEVLIQGGNNAQSPQWKNTRAAASPVSSPSLAPTTTSLKNLPQQQGRTQQGHTQISFGVNSKPGNSQHGQQIPTGNQSPSPPVAVGSPPTSVSKSAGGSPRASSTGSKVGSTPSLSSQQQAKNSTSGPSRKSSPVGGGRNVPSNLGNSHVSPAPGATTKSNQSLHHQSHMQQQTHMQQQQHIQQQQQKQAMQQAQLFFSSTYMQAQSPQSTSSASNTTGTPNMAYYQQQPRRQQPGEQQQGSHGASSGMLSLSPSLTLAGNSTSDPTKAVAAATANMKGGLPPPTLIQAAQFATQSGGHQFMSSSFPYLHPLPGVQVKPSDQKQPAGNDNLHASWQPEKR